MKINNTAKRSPAATEERAVQRAAAAVFVFCESLFYNRKFVRVPPPGSALRLRCSAFSVHRLIGRGSFGRAFVASAGTAGLCVLKVVEPRRGEDLRRLQSRLLGERDALLRARGPYTPRLFACFLEARAAVFVQEFVDGGSLAYVKRVLKADNGRDLRPALEAVVAGGPTLRLPVLTRRQASTAAFYLAELLCAVSFLHVHGVLHGDLKENNVLVTCRGHIKLIDFGLATLPRCPRSHGPPCGPRRGCLSNRLLCAQLPGPAALWGNRQYAAPEMVSNSKKTFTDKGDYWSVGVLLFLLIFGCKPYRRTDRGADLLLAISQWPSLSFMRRDILGRRCKDHPELLAAFFCLIAEEETRLCDSSRGRWAPSSWPLFAKVDLTDLCHGPAPINIPSNSKALSLTSRVSLEDLSLSATPNNNDSFLNCPFFTFQNTLSDPFFSK